MQTTMEQLQNIVSVGGCEYPFRSDSDLWI